MHVKKGDNIIILTGKDKGKSGRVMRAFPKTGKVIVEGLNMMKRHQRARRSNEKGTILNVPMPIHASNVKKA